MPYCTRSKRKHGSSYQSMQPVPVDGSRCVRNRTIGHEDEGDCVVFDIGFVETHCRETQRVVTASDDDSGLLESSGDDEDESSVISDFTEKSDVHTGADSSNPKLDGLDDVHQMMLACSRRFHHMSIRETLEVGGSIV